MNDVTKTHVIELNNMTLMMLKHLREHQAEEPPQPDDGVGRYEHEEMTAQHYEWSRTHQAIRLLLGVQLVNLAVEQLDQNGDVPG
jgi:hypothetical protein